MSSTTSIAKIVLLVIAALLSGSELELASAISHSTCSKYESNMGATFDLTDMIRAPGQPSYVVEDGDLPCTKVVEQNFTYIFNVCGAVADSIPEKCLTMSGLSSAGALQVDKRDSSQTDDDFCFVVGSYSESTTTMALLNADDPTQGLSLTYFGDRCNHPPAQRKFTIELTCADKLNPVPSHAFENSHCVYTVTIPSIYGCPVECPVTNRRLCGGNGHCAYDYDNNKAMCFCNHGWSGADCSTESSTASSGSSLNYSPALLGLIITLFVIIAVLVVSIVLMIKQLSAYREDIANYQVLKGDEDSTVV